jgi:hypothetical protein
MGNRPKEGGGYGEEGREYQVHRSGGQKTPKCQHHSVLQPVILVLLFLTRLRAFPVVHMSPLI